MSISVQNWLCAVEFMYSLCNISDLKYWEVFQIARLITGRCMSNESASSSYKSFEIVLRITLCTYIFWGCILHSNKVNTEFRQYMYYIVTRQSNLSPYSCGKRHKKPLCLWNVWFWSHTLTASQSLEVQSSTTASL